MTNFIKTLAEKIAKTGDFQKKKAKCRQALALCRERKRGNALGVPTLFIFHYSFFILGSYAYAEEPNTRCLVENEIMLSVLKTEGHNKRELGYPYLISFNNKKDVALIKKTHFKNYFIDNRTIDCKNEKNCVEMADALFSVGIKNLDLGAYQINSKYHKLGTSTYFDLKKSYYVACSYIQKNIDKYGYHWKSIAAYHSLTPSVNLKYQYALIKNFEKIVKK